MVAVVKFIIELGTDEIDQHHASKLLTIFESVLNRIALINNGVGYSGCDVGYVPPLATNIQMQVGRFTQRFLEQSRLEEISSQLDDMKRSIGDRSTSHRLFIFLEKKALDLIIRLYATRWVRANLGSESTLFESNQMNFDINGIIAVVGAYYQRWDFLPAKIIEYGQW